MGWTGDYVPKKELVDVFVPTISNHLPFIRRAFGSILFQEYEPLRTVLWIEDPGQHEIERFLNEFWYEPDERKPSPEKSDVPVEVEYCKKGVLARNYQGRTCNAWRARQWIFEWEGKSDYVKMLDCDDILMPWAIKFMMRDMTEDLDVVFHPLLAISGNRVGNIVKNHKGETAIGGAAQMLMRKRSMKKILDLGFRWDAQHDDTQFYQFFRDNNFKYALTPESAMYLYIK
jgi:hypothetical protein